MGIFDSILWVIETVLVNSKAILKIWVIDITILAVANNMTVSKIIVIFGTVFSESVMVSS